MANGEAGKNALAGSGLVAGDSDLGGQAGQPPSEAAGGVTVSHFPGGTAEEEQVIAPLFSDVSAAANDWDALIELAGRVGVARGYAMCRCAIHPLSPPSSVAGAVTSCASDEAGGLRGLLRFPAPARAPVPNGDMRQCLKDPDPPPELFQALRCEIEGHQADGKAWLDWCLADQTSMRPVVPRSCDSSVWRSASDACLSAVYCDDGTRVSGTRCNGHVECTDASEEQGCFEVTGNDNFVCGASFVPLWSLCSDDCSAALEPPVCDPADVNQFLCADGSSIPSPLLCNRERDCPDSSDEASCAR
jgi:Low-density lipoprotein receptor domain class A